MEKEKILSADVLDIIFDGRNKAYGAYTLRKEYDIRLWKAIGGMIAVLLIVMFLFRSFKEKDLVYAKFYDIPEPANKSLKMPEKPKVVTPVHKRSGGNMSGRSSKIQIVKNAGPIKINTQPGIPTPDTASVSGPGPGKYVPGPPSEIPSTSSTLTVPAASFESKVINASFPGGDAAWKKYLERYLDKETAINNNAPAGEYKVIIVFKVDTEGRISDVKAETNFGYGMETEAVRVIKRGPNWIPAQQNDQKLNVYRRQPVTFMVTE